MAQKFPYERASLALAEAEIFGDKAVLAKYGIDQSTLWRWRDRAKDDAKLHETSLLRKRMLLVDWQQDATKTIKIAMGEIAKRMQTCQTEEDSKALEAIGRTLKVVGDLKLAYDALNEPESNDVPTNSLQSQSVKSATR